MIRFTLYKIYYGDYLVYLGRTKQNLQQRIRGHMFSKPMHRNINIHQVTNIEYANFKTEADMYVYEVYLINKFHPPLNIDDKAHDELTVTLPDIEFIPYECKLMDKWRKELTAKGEAQHYAQRSY